MDYLVRSSNTINTYLSATFANVPTWILCPCRCCYTSSLRERQRHLSSKNSQFHLQIGWGLLPSYTQPAEQFSLELTGEIWAFPTPVLLNLLQTFWRSSHLPVGSASERKTLQWPELVAGSEHTSVLHSRWLSGDPAFTTLFATDTELSPGPDPAWKDKEATSFNGSVRASLAAAFTVNKQTRA